MQQESHLRALGSSDLYVSPVGFGCWPIAGVSSLDVNDRDSLATLNAALDSGINFFDTAYSYGYAGEADRLLAQFLKGQQKRVVLASKVGQYFNANRQRIVDGRPETLAKHAREILGRLGIEQLDLLYLHVPDPNVPVAESAGAIQELIRDGVARYAGVSNVDSQQLVEFQRECPVTVVQQPFNMLQQEQVRELGPSLQRSGGGVAAYWVLMKGLLAGKLGRDHQFDPRDKRKTYAIYQGELWQRSQDFLSQIRRLAEELDCTVAQLVVAWTLQAENVTVALCGAKRASQIIETAEAMQLRIPDSAVQQIDAWIEDAGAF